MAGIVAGAPQADQKTDPEDPLTRSQVVRDLALDLQCALSRQGRAPFVLSGLPMFDDLCALRQALGQCLLLGEDPTLRQWHSVLDRALSTYEAAFAAINQALEWVAGIKTILAVPLPTAPEPGPDGDEVALALAHYLGQLADRTDLNPWLAQFRDEMLALSERYWSGLCHCYHIEGLPPTNNDHESLYGQLKRQLRRQLGVSQLRQPLLRRGAWTIFNTRATSPAELRARLAEVSWEDYFAERARYEHRQDQFRRLHRWRHQRDVVLQQRVAHWSKVLSNC